MQIMHVFTGDQSEQFECLVFSGLVCKTLRLQRGNVSKMLSLRGGHMVPFKPHNKHHFNSVWAVASENQMFTGEPCIDQVPEDTSVANVWCCILSTALQLDVFTGSYRVYTTVGRPIYLDLKILKLGTRYTVETETWIADNGKPNEKSGTQRCSCNCVFAFQLYLLCIAVIVWMLVRNTFFFFLLLPGSR